MPQILLGSQKSGYTKLRTSLTLASSIMFLILSAAICFILSIRLNDSNKQTLMNKAEITGSFIASKLETNPKQRESHSLEMIIEKVMAENDVQYLVLISNDGSVFKASHLDAAEKNLYLMTDWKDQFKDSLRTYKAVVPVLLANSKEANVYIGLSSTDYFGRQNFNNLLSVFIGCIIFLVGMIFLYVVNMWLTIPLKKMVKTAVEISNGDLDQRIFTKKKNELGILSQAYNSLANQLEEAYARIENVNNELKFYFKQKVGELNLEINQRRNVEHSLRQSEEQFKLLFDMAPIGMVLCSIDGKIIKVNKAFCEELSFTEDELTDKSLYSLTSEEDKEKDKKLHLDLLNRKFKYINFEKKLIKKNKGLIHVIYNAVTICDDDGKPVNIVSQIIDITKRIIAESELIEAKDKAEASDRLKSAFLAQMSHEIRTPLNVILTATPLLVDEVGTYNSDTLAILDSVTSAGKRLQRTIDLILNMSSVQSGSYNPDFEVINLGDELRRLSEEFKTISAEKNLDLKYKNEVFEPFIFADKYTFLQIFQNLVGNSVKYTPKGKVEISVTEWKNKIIVSVSDTGIGMTEEFMKKLFSPFSQEDTGHKRKFEGNGLGLALVKKYVEINKASIDVQSRKGVGSAFTVTFDKYPGTLDVKNQFINLSLHEVRTN
jgi:PAS domain S-box-containing protein